MRARSITRVRDADDVDVTGLADKGALLWDVASAKFKPADVVTQTEFDSGGMYLPVVDGWSSPIPHPFLFVGSAAATAGQSGYGWAERVRETGTISDIAIFVGGTTSGNMDAGIYRFDGTTYNKVWSKGSTPTPGGNAWTSLGNPAVAVTRDELIFYVFCCDNSTATFARITAVANGNQSILPTGWTPAGSSRIAWQKSLSFPLPASFAESAVAVSGNIWALAGRITQP